jgi:hypothetical protein
MNDILQFHLNLFIDCSVSGAIRRGLTFLLQNGYLIGDVNYMQPTQKFYHQIMNLPKLSDLTDDSTGI